MSEKANGKATAQAETKKVATKETRTNGKPAANQPTVEELQKKVEELTARLTTIPRNLDERIEYFNHKKELIRKLGKLEANAQSLQTHLDAIAELAAVNDFETEDYVLTIEGGGKYSRKQVFALQNPVLIGDVLTYLLGKMEAKTTELKKEIEA